MLIHALAAFVAATTVAAPQDTAPQWSSTGAVAFDRKAPARSGVYIVPATGRKAILFVPGTFAAWKPGGAELAAVRGGRTLILGREGGQIASLPGWFVGWSADGLHTAWITAAGLVVGDAEAGNAHLVAPSPVTSAAWSPDGTRIAFTSTTGVLVVDRDGSGLHSVYAESGPTHPSWSFDSHMIAFETTAGLFRHVWLVGADGSNPHALALRAWNDRLPVWAPFTSHLAFVSDRRHPGGMAALYVEFLPSGATRKEADDVNPSSPPAWSPDARRLAYSARRGCARWAIFVKLYGARTDRRLTNAC